MLCDRSHGRECTLGAAEPFPVGIGRGSHWSESTLSLGSLPLPETRKPHEQKTTTQNEASGLQQVEGRLGKAPSMLGKLMLWSPCLP